MLQQFSNKKYLKNINESDDIEDDVGTTNSRCSDYGIEICTQKHSVKTGIVV